MLLLHGGGQTRHAFDGTARRIAQAGFLAVSLDQRGHGESEWVASGAYAFADYARDVEAVAAALAAESGLGPSRSGRPWAASRRSRRWARSPTSSPGWCWSTSRPGSTAAAWRPCWASWRSARSGFASIEEAADAIAAYLPHRERPRSLAGLRKNLRRSDDGRWRWHWDPRFLQGPRAIDADAAATERTLLAAAALPDGAGPAGARPVQRARDRGARPRVPGAGARAEYADIAGAHHMVAGDRNDVFTRGHHRLFKAAIRGRDALDRACRLRFLSGWNWLRGIVHAAPRRPQAASEQVC